MTLAERLQLALDQAPDGPLKPIEVERRTKFSRAAISLILNGRTLDIKFANAKKVERATGFRAEWLMDGTLPQRVIDLVRVNPTTHPDLFKEMVESPSDLRPSDKVVSLPKGTGKISALSPNWVHPQPTSKAQFDLLRTFDSFYTRLTDGQAQAIQKTIMAFDADNQRIQELSKTN